MDHKAMILGRLLDKYERSAHAKQGRTSNRRVFLDLGGKEYPEYRDNQYEILSQVNQAVYQLAEAGLITYDYEKALEGHVISRLYLCLNRVDEVYGLLERQHPAVRQQSLLGVFETALQTVSIPWVRKLVEDQIERLVQGKKLDRFLPKEAVKVEGIMQVFTCLEQRGANLTRVISQQCFHDSKYLARELQSYIVAMAKRCEPEIAAYQQHGQPLNDHEILTHIGLIPYPEIFEFCGDITLTVNHSDIPAGEFRSGFCLHSGSLGILQNVDLSGISRVLLIENRTNYQHMVMQQSMPDTLLFYHGGFYSPAKKKLLQMLYQSRPDMEYHFWADIDLGGFLMFARLRREIIPNLQPHRMDLQTYQIGRTRGLVHTEEYFEKLSKLLIDEAFSLFDPVIRAILKHRVTIEQETLLD